MNWDTWSTQTATRKPATGQNYQGDLTYGTAASIKVRWVWKRELIRDTRGDEVVSEASVLTTTKLEPGDLISHPDDSKEWPVRIVKDVRDVNGNLHYYEARL